MCTGIEFELEYDFTIFIVHSSIDEHIIIRVNLSAAKLPKKSFFGVV